MRILWAMDFDCNKDWENGGDVFSTHLLVNALRGRGHTVTTTNPTWPDNMLPWYVNRVRTATKFARGLRRLFKSDPPSVVIAQNHVYPYVVREAEKAGIPTVVIARDTQYRCPQPPHSNGCDSSCAYCVGKMALLPYPWFRHHLNMRRKYLTHADACVVCSEHLAQDMRTWVQGTRPHVVYPPIDTSHHPEAWDPRNVLFMGWGEYKGADIAIEIARMFEGVYNFTICGNQHLEHEVEFKRLSNVDYNGFIPRDIAFSKAKVLIAPARWNEPFGRIVAEACHIGIPCLISNRGGMPEAMGKGGHIIDDPEDIDEWARSLEVMMEDKIHWRSLHAYARSHAQKFNVDIQSAKLEKVLEGVA